MDSWIKIYWQPLFLLLLCSSQAEACSCAPISDKGKICAADFTGIVQVKSVTRQNYNKIYQIEVREVWRNKKPQKLPALIETAQDEAMCGIGLDIQSEYLVSGWLKPDGRLHVSLCGCLFRKTMFLDANRRQELLGNAKSCSQK